MSRKSTTKTGTTAKRTRKSAKQAKNAEVNNKPSNFEQAENDTSPHIPQRSKIKNHLVFKKQYDFSEKQQHIIAEIMNKENKVIFLEGPSGTSKTFLSVLAALKLIDQKKVSHLIYVRSLAESASKSIGALKGPQPLFSKIMTPDGWTTMGEIKKGDKVIAYDGSVCEVLETYDQGENEVFKVTTSDGRSTHCCDNHAWFTQSLAEENSGKDGSVKSLSEIRNSLMGSSLNKRLSKRMNHAIPLCSPIPYEEKSYIIQPYTMGALLGDGCFSGSTTIISSDYEIPERIKKEVNPIGCDLDLDCYKDDGSCVKYNIYSDTQNSKPSKRIEFSNIHTGKKLLFNSRSECLSYFSSMTQNDFYKLKSGDIYNDYYVKTHEPFKSTNPIRNEIINLDLVDTQANTKFIPDIYKYGNIEQRIDLLNGLMDTDGCTSGSHSVFYTSSPQLANDVIQLVRSLGGTANLRIRDRTKKTTEIKGRTITVNYLSYECRISLNGINPFYLKRKHDKYSSYYMQKVRIESVEPIDKMQTKCIKIDHPSHLYITDDFIVTHNTMEEKYMPFLLPLEEKLQEIIEAPSKAQLYEQERIEAIPINFLRGASINAACLLVDEAQNMTMKELVTAITRIGEFSKFIFIGDPMQSDINGKSGFKKMFDMFNTESAREQGIKCFSFDKDDIVRSGILKFIAEVIEDDGNKARERKYSMFPDQENEPVQSIYSNGNGKSVSNNRKTITKSE